MSEEVMEEVASDGAEEIVETEDIIEEPIDRPWNPLESIELDDNDDPLF